MKRLILCAALVVLIGDASVDAAITHLAVDFEDGPRATIATSGGVYGWEFSVASSIVVESLGVWDDILRPYPGGPDPGLHEEHAVGVWDADDSSLLYSTTVTNSSTIVTSLSTAGRWYCEDIDSLRLGPGRYVIGAQYFNTEFFDTDAMRSWTVGTTVRPGIEFLALRHPGTTVGFSMPVGISSAYGHFGPNFQYRAIPEPSSLVVWLLIGLTFAGIHRVTRTAIPDSG